MLVDSFSRHFVLMRKSKLHFTKCSLDEMTPLLPRVWLKGTSFHDLSLYVLDVYGKLCIRT